MSYFLFHSAVHSVRGKSSLFAHLLERAESEGELYLRWESKTSLRKEKKKGNVSTKEYMFLWSFFWEREKKKKKVAKCSEKVAVQLPFEFSVKMEKWCINTNPFTPLSPCWDIKRCATVLLISSLEAHRSSLHLNCRLYRFQNGMKKQVQFRWHL